MWTTDGGGRFPRRRVAKFYVQVTWRRGDITNSVHATQYMGRDVFSALDMPEIGCRFRDKRKLTHFFRSVRRCRPVDRVDEGFAVSEGPKLSTLNEVAKMPNGEVGSQELSPKDAVMYSCRVELL